MLSRSLVSLALTLLTALTSAQEITTVAEARTLLARADATPVTVQGEVTFIDKALGLAFIQDRTGGIAFDPRQIPAMLKLKTGDAARLRGHLEKITGITALILDAEGDAVTHAVSSDAVRPLSFDLDNAPQMRVDGHLTRVSGIVRRVTLPKGKNLPMTAEISTPGGYALARLPWREPDAATLDAWLNQPVSLTAVLICRVSKQILPEDACALLLVPKPENWQTDATSLDEVFSRQPVISLQDISATQRNVTENRILLHGTVTAQRQRQWITLRTADGSILISTRQNEVFSPGEQLAVACWPQLRGSTLHMIDGICRRLGIGDPPVPLELDGSTLPTAETSAELVRLTGVLQNHAVALGQPRLILTLPGRQNYLLQWAPQLPPEIVTTWRSGSTFTITGILSALPAGVRNEMSAAFGIQPRTLDDITLVSAPSWWTRERLQVTAWTLLAFLAAVIVAAAFLRWQVRRQQRHIRTFETRAIAEEERRRIAREFHDSLQQQLVSATLHLEALQGAVQSTPDLLPRMITEAAELLRHCQVEARHCIWDLRSDAPTRESLAQTLDEWLEMRLTHAADAQLEFEMTGEMPAILPAEAPLHLMRIAQEAVNNALAHAQPSRVKVRLTCTPESVTLTVEDDGRGFGSALNEQHHEGHYGLSHMRERADKMGAELRFTAGTQGGTLVTVLVSVRSPAHELSPQA